MRIVLTGTGAAGGVPRYGCDCQACQVARVQPEHRRLPCSALLETDQGRLILDAGLMDLHERYPPGSLDAILLTHFHADHVQGLLHLRWGVGDKIRVLAPPDEEGFADLLKHPGLLQFEWLTAFEPIDIKGMRITPLPLIHSKITYGYAIEAEGCRFAYLTDTAGLPADSLAFLQQWQPQALALDCSHVPQETPPTGHNDLTMALALIEQLAPAKAWLTHLSHKVDLWRLQTGVTLPEQVCWGQDNTIIELN